MEFLPKTISGTSAEGPRSVALSDTSALVWDDPSGGTRTGMLAGVIIGVVAGGTIGAASCRKPDDTGVCSIAPTITAAVLGLAGLGIGAIVGRLVGADARFDLEPPAAPATNP